jgi:serine/threonine protein kinase
LSALSDAAVARLKSVASWPEFASDRYSVTEEIGRGGMGTIYLAIDRELGREVAIKVPLGVGSSTLERRLQTEARVLARLEHPGIVPIHDVGRLVDGRLFYVMKRVRGRTLPEYLRDVQDINEALRIFERICEPVAFAHSHGCIHRDLKPENVMIGAFGEVMVMDWGVARMDAAGSEPSGSAAPADGSATHPGTVVGTFGFMAPEQARGAAGSVDQRADVYGLGAILYSLLAGEAPGPGSGAAAAMVRRRDVPRPLRAICARALAPEARNRYATVSALAHDVAQYRAGGPVTAHRENLLERSMRVARVYRVALVLMVTYIFMRVIVALLVGS